MNKTISALQNELLGVFNHILSKKDRNNLKRFLNDIMCKSNFYLAIDVAGTLYDKVITYHKPYCSERQAYVIAREAVELHIGLQPIDIKEKPEDYKPICQPKEETRTLAHPTLYLTREELENKKKELSLLQAEYAKENNRLRSSDGLVRLVGAEFDEAMLTLARLEQKIERLKYLTGHAHIVSGQTDGVVSVLSRVRIKDMGTQKELDAKIVRENDSDAVIGSSISCASPVGKSLLGHVANDTVSVNVDGRVHNYQILSVA